MQILFSSTMQDDMIIIHCNDGYDSVLESVFKTEILTSLTKSHKNKLNRELPVQFSDKWVLYYYFHSWVLTIFR